MILRIERIDQAGSMTFDVEKVPIIGDVVEFGGNYYLVNNVIKFNSHTTILVRETNVIEISPSQIIKGERSE